MATGAPADRQWRSVGTSMGVRNEQSLNYKTETTTMHARQAATRRPRNAFRNATKNAPPIAIKASAQDITVVHDSGDHVGRECPVGPNCDGGTRGARRGARGE